MPSLYKTAKQLGKAVGRGPQLGDGGRERKISPPPEILPVSLLHRLDRVGTNEHDLNGLSAVQSLEFRVPLTGLGRVRELLARDELLTEQVESQEEMGQRHEAHSISAVPSYGLKYACTFSQRAAPQTSSKGRPASAAQPCTGSSSTHSARADYRTAAP